MRVIRDVDNNKPILLNRVLGWLGIPSINTGVAEHHRAGRVCLHSPRYLGHLGDVYRLAGVGRRVFLVLVVAGQHVPGVRLDRAAMRCLGSHAMT